MEDDKMALGILENRISKLANEKISNNKKLVYEKDTTNDMETIEIK